MRVFGLVGRSGSGKTTLMVELVAGLRRLGVTVSTVKHAHHGFDMDQPGKDSHRHRDAGAEEVMVVSGTRWALLHEHRGEVEPDLDDLIGRLAPVDVVLVEGFHTHGHPAIEVHRPSHGKPLIYEPGSPDIIAVASDLPLAGLGVPCLDLNDIGAIVDFVLEHLPTAPAHRRPHLADYSLYN